MFFFEQTTRFFGNDMTLYILKVSASQMLAFSIDKNFLFTGGSIRNVLLCVKNILPQDVGCGTSDRAEDITRHPSF